MAAGALSAGGELSSDVTVGVGVREREWVAVWCAQGIWLLAVVGLLEIVSVSVYRYIKSLYHVDSMANVPMLKAEIELEERSKRVLDDSMAQHCYISYTTLHSTFMIDESFDCEYRNSFITSHL